MDISKEDFKRAISLAYQRGRVTPISYISKDDIRRAIRDVHEWVMAQPSNSADEKPECFLEIDCLAEGKYEYCKKCSHRR